MESKYKIGKSEVMLTLILISVFLPYFQLMPAQPEETEFQKDYFYPVQSDSSISKPLLDGEIDTIETKNYTTNSSIIPEIPIDKSLQSIEYNITTAQQTQQIIQNGQMDVFGTKSVENWTLATSSNNTAGIVFARNNSVSNQNSLMIGINGSQSSQNFSCFPSPSYTETFDSFENLAQWNIVNEYNPTEYNITLYQSMTYEISSKAIQSPFFLMNYSGQLIKNFYYNGTSDITDAHLDFSYSITSGIGPEIANLTVWIQKPNLEKLWLRNESFTSGLSTQFDLIDLAGIFTQTGNYSLIFQFNQSVKTNQNEINIDDVRFWITYKARNILPNESIGFQQTLPINRTVLNNGILSISVFCETPLSQINTSETIFFVKLGNTTIGTRQLQNIPFASWINLQWSVNKSILTPGSINITMGWQFDTTNTTVFRPNDLWQTYFDNISLSINTIPNREEIKILVQCINSGEFEPIIMSNFSSQQPSIGIIRIQANTTGWLNSSQFSFVMRYNDSVFPINFGGNLTYIYYSWRDFIVRESIRVFDALIQYPEEILEIFLSPKISWAHLLNFSLLFPYIAQENYPYLIYQANELEPNFGRYFASYIFWQNQNPDYKPSQMDFMLNALSTVQNSSETGTTIKNILNSYWRQTTNILQNKFDTFYQQLPQMVYSNTINLSVIQQQIALITQKMNLALQGYPTAIQLSSMGNSLEFPSLIWWEDFLTAQTDKLTRVSAKENDILIDWIKQTQSQDNKTYISAGYPALFQNGMEQTSEFELTAIPISQQLFFSMALFELVLNNFQLMKSLETTITDWNETLFNEYAEITGVNRNFTTQSLFDPEIGQHLPMDIKKTNNESILFQMPITMDQWENSRTSQSAQTEVQYQIWTFLPKNSSLSQLIPQNIITGQMLKSKIEAEKCINLTFFQTDSLIQQEVLNSAEYQARYTDLLFYLQISDYNRILFSNWSTGLVHTLTKQVSNRNLTINQIQSTNHLQLREPITDQNFTLHEYRFSIVPIIPQNLWLDIQWNQNSIDQETPVKLAIPIQEFSTSTRIQVNQIQFRPINNIDINQNPFSILPSLNGAHNITLSLDPIQDQIKNLGSCMLSTINVSTPLKDTLQTISGNNQIEIKYTVSSNLSIQCLAEIHVVWRIISPYIYADPIDTTPIWVTSIGLFAIITVIYVVRQKKRMKQIKLREEY